jgi:hypothetical protein
MKRVVFLLGAMGSGKSTILAMSQPKAKDDYVLKCIEYDILGKSVQGADTLSSHKKENVIASLRDYEGCLVVASIFYSQQIDVTRFDKLGFDQRCIFLNVTRNEVYRRVLKRGGGSWNEKTYTTNLKRNIAFYKKFPYKKTIWVNELPEHAGQNFEKLVSLCEQWN